VNVVEAFGRAVDAMHTGGPIAMYPEGRISLDPGLWPERGKTGAARLALAAQVPVIPISQWGAQEAAIWGTKTVTCWHDFQIVAGSWLRAVWARPRLRVHFGAPVDLSGLSATRLGDAVRARDRIMRAVTDGLVPLRANEPDVPRFQDPTRPVTARSPWRPPE
ncbi:MAG: lysophospholipid acyltransferase family protein, partial [Sciscionella sp.]